MSVKGEIKQGAGLVKEELNEHGKSPKSQRKAQEGRNLRNEGGSKTARHQRRPNPVPAIPRNSGIIRPAESGAE
jgi:hypothetical protein